MNVWIIFWLACFIVLAVIEIATLGLTTCWFAAGSAVAAILAAAGAGFVIEFIAMAAVSLFLMFLIRPLVKDRFNKNREKTNAEALAGRTAVVTEDITPLGGAVNAGGLIWSALSADGNETIQTGSEVIIKHIKGVTLYVTKKEEL